LRLIATLDANDQPKVMGVLCYSGKETVIQFYVDVGATYTTLLDYNVSKLGINWRTLNRTEECIGASETSKPYVIKNAVIKLPVEKNSETSLQPYPLKEIFLIPPKSLLFKFPFSTLGSNRVLEFNNWWLNKPLKRIPLVKFNCSFSLLGMDILKQFAHWHWYYDTKVLILES
jgi:hypothetical protein